MARVAAALLAPAWTLALAATGFADTQKVKDPHGDGHAGCEIYAATAGHAKGGRLKHTITVRDRISSKALAPIVLIFGRKSEVGGAPRATLSSGSSGVKDLAEQEQAHGHLHDQGDEAAVRGRDPQAPEVVLLGGQRLLRQSGLGAGHPQAAARS